ncbi:MAG: DnaJ domain-containing protein [Chlorobiota bacterium]|nr:DnaJ domain-containing protein [Chlorobiota bacterium]QQS67427.1 MAG: DnaJ domain-containing protein [Chlorobiota bacterium]
MSFSQIISRINRIANSYKSSFSSYDEDLKVAEEYINSYNKNKEIYDEIIDKQEDLEFINAYKLLDVDKDDKLETIVNSFRKLLKKYHPDNFTNESEEQQLLLNDKVREIIKAYELLKSVKEKK